MEARIHGVTAIEIITAETIAKGVERLNEAGLWATAYSRFSDDLESSSDSVYLLTGSVEEPKLIGVNGMERRTLPNPSFHVQFVKSTLLFRADFFLSMVSITLSVSDQFDEVIGALVNFASLQAHIPTRPRAVLEAIFMLKRTGLQVNLRDEGILEAKDKLHTFAIHRVETGWKIRVDDSDQFFKAALPTLVHAVYHVIDFYDVQ